MMNTRAKSKITKKAIPVSNENLSDQLQRYAQTINILKADLEKEKCLSQTLECEQEQNAKEFEKVLTENANLKKKMNELEENLCSSYDSFQNLTENYQLLENNNKELENILETKQILQNKKKMIELQKKYDDLQINYLDLLSSNESRGNTFISVKPSKMKLGRLRKINTKVKKITKKCANLRATKMLMEKEISLRNITIRDLQNQCERFLEIIKRYEKEMQQENRIQTSVLILETKFKEIEKIIDLHAKEAEKNQKNSMKNIEEENTNDQNIDEIKTNDEYTNNNKDTDENKVNEKYTNKQKTLKTINENQKRDNILIFSDSHAKNLGSKLCNIMDADGNITNICMPNAKILSILDKFDKDSKLLEENDTAVLLLSDFNENNAKDCTNYPELLQEKISWQRKCKVIVCSMKYNGYNDTKIYEINNKLHHIAAVNGNVKYLDLNTLLYSEKKSRKTTQSAIAQKIIYAIKNYQVTSSLQFIKCDQFSEASAKNLPKGGFQPTELLRELT